MRTLCLLFCLLLAACGGGDKPALNVGDAAPAFSGPQLDGPTFALAAGGRGQPLVIRFWADWCRYCEGEMRSIEPVYQQYRNRGLTVLAINAGQDRATVAAFIARLGISYPVLLDEDAAIARRYAVVGLPTTYFVDPAGVVRAKLVGEADAATFERHVRALLP
ncbi:MAG: hypothetical protein RIR00_503 [Pseudomonadota bacterium]|jgi:peroxiredoxin